MLVDASPDVLQNYNDSLTRIYKMHNLTEANARSMPDLSFKGIVFILGMSIASYIVLTTRYISWYILAQCSKSHLIPGHWMETKNNLSQHFRISGPHQEKQYPDPKNSTAIGLCLPVLKLLDLSMRSKILLFMYHCFYKCSGFFSNTHKIIITVTKWRKKH